MKTTGTRLSSGRFGSALLLLATTALLSVAGVGCASRVSDGWAQLAPSIAPAGANDRALALRRFPDALRADTDAVGDEVTVVAAEGEEEGARSW